MNPNEKLIIAYNKSQSTWEDITEETQFIRPKTYYGHPSGYEVTFQSGKTYPYNLESIKYMNTPQIIDITNHDFYVNGHLYFDIKKVLKFENIFKIFHTSGNTTITFNFKLKARDTLSQTNIFMYYKALADYAQQNYTSEDSIQAFIHKQYQQMAKVKSSSCLYAYFTGVNQSLNNSNTPLFPFDFNLSQKKALITALNHQVSIIEGPPGCGKTQTILNILMNLVYQNMRVAVVSNNNTAISNIVEKLQESHLDFLCALLGNKDNKTQFFMEKADIQSQQHYLNAFKHYDPLKLESFDLTAFNNFLDQLHTYENERAQLQIDIEAIKLEYNHFLVKFKNELDSNLIQLKPRASEAYLKAKVYIETTRKWTFWSKYKLRSIYKIANKWLKTLNPLILQLENDYYVSKLKEITNRISELDDYLTKNDFNQVKAKYIEKSKGVLYQKLKSSYFSRPREDYAIDDYKHNFEQFTRQYPIILSTAHSLLTSIDKDAMFDYLIVDEASQSELLSSILSMSVAKNIIVVGDSKQLDQIDDTELEAISIKLAQKCNVPKPYLYNHNSLLSSIKAVFPKAPVTLLKEHYRCHPTIINFLNQKFYDNELIVMTKMQGEAPIELIQLGPGNHARKNPNGSGQYSQREIDESLAYLEAHPIQDLGIITPFRYQALKYQERLLDYPAIESDTVHRFQGRQKDTILLSTVVNSIEKTEQNERLYDFINNPKLFNVAISRAKHKIILIGSEGVFQSEHNHFSDFIAYAKYHTEGTKLTKATVTSVFDSLYGISNELYKNSDKLIITERLILNLIQDTLQTHTPLKVSMHVSLNKILKDFSIFDEVETKYLNHYLTHVDFLIYNPITKQNVLAIEVDGIQYHEQSEKQTLRDQIKNKAFQVNHIPLLRLKTNGSSEKYLIETALNARPNDHT